VSARNEGAVWIDGHLLRGAEATLSVFDRGARDGEGLLETLRVYGGVPFLWAKHLERLVLSAAALGFPVPPAPERLREAVALVLDAEGLADAAIRITVTRGVPGGRPVRACGWVEASPIAARLWSGPQGDGARLIVSRRPFAPGPLGPHKTTSRLAYHLAREEARARRADEALLVGSDGYVLEGAVSNVFAVRRGVVLTPPLASGILPGVTRAFALDACAGLGLEAREEELTLASLAKADEVFLTNSLQEIVPVAWLEDRTLPPPRVGPRLAAAYREAVAAATAAARGDHAPSR